MPVELDITDSAQIQAAVDAAMTQFGRIDVLVNNAGYGLLGFFEEMSEKQIGDQMETNVFGTMKLTRAVLPIMRTQGSGWIIVVTSTSGVRPAPGGSIYSASKFALEGWTEGLSYDLKPFGIRCMVIEPGPFRTDFLNEKASAVFSELKVKDYEKYRETLHDEFIARDKNQPGDPVKLAKGLMKALGAANPPLRLLGGKIAVKIIDEYLKNRREELETWKEVSESMDFE